MTDLDTLSDEDLLLAIQAGVPDAQTLLSARFGPYLTSVAENRVRKLRLPRTDAEDIVQAVYARAADPASNRFRPERCSSRRFLGGLVFNEAKHLKLQSRERWDRGRGSKVSRRPVLAPVGVARLPRPGGEDTDEGNVLELVQTGAADPLRQLQSKSVLARLLEHEPAIVREVVRLHFEYDIEIQDVAHECGLSRFRISRVLRDFYGRARQLPGLRAELQAAV